jgi:hypothetical protein
MFTRTVAPHLIFSVVCSVAVLAQASPPAQESSTEPASSMVREFPVILQRGVVAGKTAVGTRVQAKLDVATLVDGTVIPRNAVFTGEVIESVAKTANDASRLAIRMDTVQWKQGSTPTKVYLTRWFYPTRDEVGQNLQYGPQQPANRTWNGQGQYPDPNSKVYKPFPSDDSNKDSTAPNTPSSSASNHRVAMKNVECEQTRDGTITIISRQANIKLDNLTTYVLATGDLQPVPAK